MATLMVLLMMTVTVINFEAEELLSSWAAAAPFMCPFPNPNLDFLVKTEQGLTLADDHIDIHRYLHVYQVSHFESCRKLFHLF